MNRPVEINVEEIRRQIQQNRALYQITVMRIAGLTNLIQALKTLVRWRSRQLTDGALAPVVGGADSLHEAELTTQYLRQVQQDEIYAALQYLLEKAEERASRDRTLASMELKMIMLPVESIRTKLRMWRGLVSTKPDEWEQVFEESRRGCVSAPSRWLCAVSDIGRCRRNNEDKYFLSADCGLWIVADGMGGRAAGEVASALTIQAIIASMDSAGSAAEDTGICVPERLSRAFAMAHDWVSGPSLRNNECRGMGSTVIAGLVDGEVLHICHVGDVRAYHLSEGRFRRITNHHSWVWEELVVRGLLTRNQARFHPKRRIVTQAIGGCRGINPEMTRVTLKAGDRVLLCSNGLWEALADEEIAAVVGSDGSVRQLASTLVDRANTAGGEDNITAILYEYKGQADKRSDLVWRPFQG